MKTHNGDILVVKEGVILQQVNCKGVMKSGIAAEIRHKYPVVYEKYLEYWNDCVEEEMLGKIIPVKVTDKLWVLNLCSQQSYGRNKEVRYTSYDALDEALHRTFMWLSNHKIKACEVHHPMIGCGLGHADWSVVQALIECHLGKNTNLWKL